MIRLLEDFLGKFKLEAGQKSWNDLKPQKSKRLREHEAGWIAIKNGRPIAEFTFIRISPPAFLFHFTLIGDDLTRKRLFEHSALRDPDPELTFQNRADPNLVVADGPFLANLWSDGVLRLRDFRK